MARMLAPLAALRRQLRALRRDRRGVAFIEFALILPIFIGVTVGGVEVANLMLVNMRVQRLATQMANIVAQRGASQRPLSEDQVYDVLAAMDVAAQPMNIRRDGRVVLSAVLGEDTNADNAADVSRIKWQRFDGGLISATPSIGCWSTSTLATLPGNRQLTLGEAYFHAQVTVRYRPIFINIMSYLKAPDTITRTSAFRGRGSTFRDVLTVEGYPPKQNCATATGL